MLNTSFLLGFLFGICLLGAIIVSKKIAESDTRRYNAQEVHELLVILKEVTGNEFVVDLSSYQRELVKYDVRTAYENDVVHYFSPNFKHFISSCEIYKYTREHSYGRQDLELIFKVNIERQQKS